MGFPSLYLNLPNTLMHTQIVLSENSLGREQMNLQSLDNLDNFNELYLQLHGNGVPFPEPSSLLFLLNGLEHKFSEISFALFLTFVWFFTVVQLICCLCLLKVCAHLANGPCQWC